MSANIGKRLRDVRKRRGMTQQGLAQESGVSLSLIRKLEQGERRDIRLETARRLAVALGVSTMCLVAESSEESVDAATLDRWAPVRQALTTPIGTHGLEEEPTVGGMRAALQAAVPLFSGDRFTELEVLLPSLIRDAEVLAETVPEGRGI